VAADIAPLIRAALVRDEWGGRITFFQACLAVMEMKEVVLREIKS